MTTDIDAPGDVPLEIVRALRGVVHAFYLDSEILEQVKDALAELPRLYAEAKTLVDTYEDKDWHNLVVLGSVQASAGAHRHP